MCIAHLSRNATQAFGIAKQRQHAADGKQAGRCKKGRGFAQTAQDLAVKNARIAGDKYLHPVASPFGHQHGDRRLLGPWMFDPPADPAPDQHDQRRRNRVKQGKQGKMVKKCHVKSLAGPVPTCQMAKLVI